jgi:ABC-type cobalamin transport system permease subunit
MREIRLPRALLGALIGAGLGLAGAALQGYLRNPLAEPGLVGVSGSAALGAVLAIHTGLAAAFTLALPVAALAGAGVGVLLILMLAGPRGGSITLILAGIAISALAAALTSLVLNLSPNPYAASEIVFWMMGSLADRSMTHVWLALPLMLAGGLALLTLGRGLDALTLGEDAAAAMGLRLARLRHPRRRASARRGRQGGEAAAAFVRQEAEGRAHQRRLARAVGADQADEFAPGHVEADGVEDRPAPQPHRQVLQRQERHASPLRVL